LVPVLMTMNDLERPQHTTSTYIAFSRVLCAEVNEDKTHTVSSGSVAWAVAVMLTNVSLLKVKKSNKN